MLVRAVKTEVSHEFETLLFCHLPVTILILFTLFIVRFYKCNQY